MNCKHQYDYSPHCGADVCMKCDFHDGLFRCFCGWSRSGGNGYYEMIEMGETIEPDEEIPY
mgnify:FL=1|tara:strand:+ start:54 stop:236 length:183 start_codon:yes stop_codon:yes gene_type:complete